MLRERPGSQGNQEAYSLADEVPTERSPKVWHGHVQERQLPSGSLLFRHYTHDIYCFMDANILTFQFSAEVTCSYGFR
jgi:hypothetical protein